jgi:hypothetical protein
MPGFKSIAQQRKWGQLLSEGRVTRDQFDRRVADTSGPLPERAVPRRRTVGASRGVAAAKLGDQRY